METINQTSNGIMAVKHTKQNWVREDYNGNSWEQLIKTKDLTVLIAEVNTQHDVERHEAIEIAKAIQKVPEMIRVLESLSKNYEWTKPLLLNGGHRMNDAKPFMANMDEVESILKSLNDE